MIRSYKDAILHKELDTSISNSVKHLSNKRFKITIKLFINQMLLNLLSNVTVLRKANELAQKNRYPYTVKKSRKSK